MHADLWQAAKYVFPTIMTFCLYKDLLKFKKKNDLHEINCGLITQKIHKGKTRYCHQILKLSVTHNSMKFQVVSI